MPVSRHDLVLAGIPSVFLPAYLFGAGLLSWPVAVASLACAALVTDCLFVHPPRERSGRADGP